MDAIGGYRLVRKLGEGPRAEVHLARLDREAEGDAGVVVKHYRPGVDAAAISTEIEALARGVGEHTVALLDVATAPSGQLALILGRLSGGSLSRLLTHRQSMSIGEVVGILSPLAGTLHGLHAAGVVHGGVRPDALLFDGAGTPVLACFGGASLIQAGLPPALMDLELGAEHDRRGLGVLARSVLEHADDHDAVRPVLDWLAAAPTDAGWSADLAERIRAIGAPAPVDLRAAAGTAVAWAIPARVPVHVVAPVVRRAELREAPSALLGRTPLRALLQSPVAKSLGGVRRRVWMLAGAVFAAFVLALLVVPAMSAAPEADAAQGPLVTPTATPDPVTVPVDEEPADALVRLLTARDACLRDRSVLCLDAVGQQGSAALAEDQELVLQLQAGAETPAPFLVQAADIEVVESLGGAVLLSLDAVADGQPAAILIAKTEEGWLLRDYLER